MPRKLPRARFLIKFLRPCQIAGSRYLHHTQRLRHLEGLWLVCSLFFFSFLSFMSQCIPDYLGWVFISVNCPSYDSALLPSRESNFDVQYPRRLDDEKTFM